jgi:hypothetical protein
MLQRETVNDWEDTKESGVAQSMVLRRDLPGMAAENHDNSKEKNMCLAETLLNAAFENKILTHKFNVHIQFCDNAYKLSLLSVLIV